MANTVMVRKANVVLEIPDDEAVIAKYLSTGYDVIGKNGKVVRQSTHGKSESELRAEIEVLNEKIAKLTKENKELKGKLDALVADVDEPAEEPVAEPVEVPKKKRQAKSKN